jgi:branched-chain amino acid aminotransferase
MSSTSNSVLRADQIWMDGEFRKWDDATVPVMTHALHYGLGTFEGIRAYKTVDGRLAIFRLKEHIERLYDSAHMIMLKMPYPAEVMMEACCELLRRQKNLFANGAYLRPIAFMGEGAMGLGAVNPTKVAITAWEWGRYLGEAGVQKGIRAKVSSFTRMHVNVNLVRGKLTGQYINSILAKREAVLGGYDEAILLDISGFVAEASGENVFMVNKQGVIKTPPLSSPILAGITRDTVLQLMRDNGHVPEEVTFTRDAMYIGREMFFCGTAAEITPVREVDDRQVGDGKVGELTQWVQKRYDEVIRGADPKYAHWLTYI